MVKPAIMWTLLIYLVLPVIILAQDPGRGPRPAVEKEEDTSSQPNPGLKGRVTQKGLNYVRQFATDMLMVQLAQLQIPDVNQSASIVDLQIKNIRITGFSPPITELEPIPEFGIYLRASHLDPTIEADYEAVIDLGLFDIDKKGTLKVIGVDISIALEFMIGRDNDGKPTVYVTNCLTDGSVSLHFTGGWSSGLNMISSLLRGRLQSIIFAQICANSKLQIETQFANLMQQTNMSQVFLNDFEFDYRMVRFPGFFDDSIESSHLGAFYWIGSGQRQLPPFVCPPIPDFPEHTSKMAYAYVTDYSLNTALFAAFIGGQLAYNVSDAILPPEALGYLSTSCTGLQFCLGSLFPALGEVYPGGSAVLAVYAARSPRLEFRDGNIHANVVANADLFIDKDGQRHHIVTIHLNVSTQFVIHINSTHVGFTLVAITPDANLGKASVEGFGEETEFFFDSMVVMATKQFLVPKLTEIGEAGIKIPDIPQVRFVNPEIAVDPTVQNILIVSTDLHLPLPELSEEIRQQASFDIHEEVQSLRGN